MDPGFQELVRFIDLQRRRLKGVRFAVELPAAEHRRVVAAVLASGSVEAPGLDLDAVIVEVRGVAVPLLPNESLPAGRRIVVELPGAVVPPGPAPPVGFYGALHQEGKIDMTDWNFTVAGGQGRGAEETGHSGVVLIVVHVAAVLAGLLGYFLGWWVWA